MKTRYWARKFNQKFAWCQKAEGITQPCHTQKWVSFSYKLLYNFIPLTAVEITKLSEHVRSRVAWSRLKLRFNSFVIQNQLTTNSKPTNSVLKIQRRLCYILGEITFNQVFKYCMEKHWVVYISSATHPRVFDVFAFLNTQRNCVGKFPSSLVQKFLK